ncbi:hypothetical protein AGDE_07441 [Angomonas deanei]|nr:hypothetical protein AGDE_07441 [Angomonas deanei]|eukprot:EPY35343.1 hypothetical protein AGDE_07441 [Angomonas deanei]
MESDDGANFDFFQTEDTTTLSTNSTSDDPYCNRDEDENYDNNGNIQIDLRETILQYQRTPADFYINIIMATLKCNTTIIDSYCFSAAAGNPLLIKTLLDSGYVDETDETVQRIIQEEIDKVVVGCPYDGDALTSDQSDYLACLFRVKSARVTEAQMTLLVHSGFDFISMLSEYSYLTDNLEAPPVVASALFNLVVTINFITGWVSLFFDLLFIASLIWVIVYWFSYPEKSNNGYWSIMVYVGGYVASFVLTMLTDETKIKHYNDILYKYPNNNVKIVPVIPLYEFLLVFLAARYELRKDKRKYFVVRYDLRNGIAIQQICQGVFYSIPQVIVQSFLFVHRRSKGTSPPFTDVCFYLLFGSSCAAFVVCIFAFVKLAVFRHSCTAFGFAFTSVYNDNVHRVSTILPSDIATLLVLFTTMCFFVSLLVSLIIFLLNITYPDCSSSSVVLLSIFVGVVSLNIIAYFLVVIYARFSRLYGLLCIPSCVMKIAYLIYVSSIHERDNGCLFTNSRTSFWMIADFVLFGCVCVTLLVWVIMTLVEVIKGKRIEQRLIDRCVIQ